MRNNQKIPEGWNVKKLGDCVSYFKGFAFKSSCYKIIGTRVIRVSDMGYDSILSKNDSVYVDYQREYNKYILQEGDIIITTVGSKPPVYNSLVGRSIKVKKENNGSLLNQNAVCLRADKINTVQNYFPYLLKMKRYIFYIEDIIRGNANQGSITLEDLFNYHFLLPPLPEQEKIALVLETWDEAIEKLSNLIEQKKLLRKGLMQKLLTGKTRLPGFTQPWKEVKLGEIGTTYTGLSGKNKDNFGRGSYFIPYMNIYQNNHINPQQLEQVEVDEGEKQNTVKYGDIFFTTSSETPEEVGFASVLLFKPERNIYLNSFCFGYRLNNFKSLLPEYASFLFRSIYARKIMYKLAQGATRFNLSKNELMKEKIYIPSDISEQQAIADVLSTADDEINLLNQKLEALKEQKKGLMQQLLTGQIRVKVN